MREDLAHRVGRAGDDGGGQGGDDEQPDDAATRAPLKSELLATWPFLRASLRRLAVGASVLSSAAI